jgi:hypothetical protein
MGLKKIMSIFVLSLFVLIVCEGGVYAAPLLDPNSAGIVGTQSQSYDALVDALCANSNVVGTVGGDKLWVPWYTTSSTCGVNELQKGGNCNSGQTIDMQHNCMVTDEFSQVGILVAMGTNQARMDQYYNTILATKSTFGSIPAWRVYRNGNTIEACKQGINGNCDTASDATARIISSLYTAAANTNFDSTARAKYKAHAITLSQDFLTYEVEQSCKTTSQGQICYWLSGGSQVKTGGPESNDYVYTGYYPDAIIAMLQACSATGDTKYCTVAKDFTNNYLAAANFNGNTFTAPPGKAFKWANWASAPSAQCTSDCNPVMWDGYDAPRALGMCQANYYAKQMNVQLGNLDKYCQLWSTKMSDPNNAPLQYTPSGAASGYQSSAYAQGLQSLFQMGGNPAIFDETLKSALNHYSTTTKTFDWTACFGVYTNAFSVRALGVGIGRDLASFKAVGTTTTTPTTTTPTTTTPTTSNTCANSVKDVPVTCTGGTITTDTWNGGRTIKCTNGADSLQIQAWDKSGYFEMYKQTKVGSKVSDICLGTTCIGNSGYAKSGSFPICSATSGTTTPTSTTTPTTTTPTTTTTTPTTAPSTTNTCANSVKDVAVTCSGGTLTSDVWSGGRTVTCANGANTLTVQAWDKTGYFEVYKKSSAGTAPKICFGTTCIQTEGYVKSSSFPICGATTSTTTSTTPVTTTTPTTTTAPAPSTQTCYNSVQSIPATCTGGSITTDSWNGGRTIKCTNGADSLQIQAWDKSGYFEMYKQTKVGSKVSQICIGSTCISDSGYAKSTNYPICR